MRFRNRSGHIIDFLFPLVLFFVLAVSALTVILFAANVYREVTETSSLNLSAWTALTYIREKVHQNDQGEEIFIGTFDGQEALILAQTVDGQRYCTYIYVYENELRELFAKEGAEVGVSAGTTILAVQDFSMEETRDGVFLFSCTDQNGQYCTATVTVRSSRFLPRGQLDGNEKGVVE